MAPVLVNKFDLGLVSHDVHDPRLTCSKFMTDKLVAIAPRNHRWAAKKRIKPQDWLQETFIVAAKGAGYELWLKNG